MPHTCQMTIATMLNSLFFNPLLQDKNRAIQDQIGALLDYVGKRPVDAYYKFRKALYNTDQGHVVEKSLPDFSKFTVSSCL